MTRINKPNFKPDGDEFTRYSNIYDGRYHIIDPGSAFPLDGSGRGKGKGRKEHREAHEFKNPFNDKSISVEVKAAMAERALFLMREFCTRVKAGMAWHPIASVMAVIERNGSLRDAWSDTTGEDRHGGVDKISTKADTKADIKESLDRLDKLSKAKLMPDEVHPMALTGEVLTLDSLFPDSMVESFHKLLVPSLVAASDGENYISQKVPIRYTRTEIVQGKPIPRLDKEGYPIDEKGIRIAKKPAPKIRMPESITSSGLLNFKPGPVIPMEIEGADLLVDIEIRAKARARAVLEGVPPEKIESKIEEYTQAQAVAMQEENEREFKKAYIDRLAEDTSNKGRKSTSKPEVMINNGTSNPSMGGGTSDPGISGYVIKQVNVTVDDVKKLVQEHPLCIDESAIDVMFQYILSNNRHQCHIVEMIMGPYTQALTMVRPDLKQFLSIKWPEFYNYESPLKEENLLPRQAMMLYGVPQVNPIRYHPFYMLQYTKMVHEIQPSDIDVYINQIRKLYADWVDPTGETLGGAEILIRNAICRLKLVRPDLIGPSIGPSNEPQEEDEEEQDTDQYGCKCGCGCVNHNDSNGSSDFDDTNILNTGGRR